ncbi:divalent-cation tolerance protein CutA [Jannaschia aquimarina]|uniref:CutA protein n=1 Tax=Jannaschia aquimarina TaxID=935700 RepID=A0A0D1CIV3_9RHOB|nr:divalent-cation tolerance protein CutA [Jannaschia aquimarina]KIT14652.1 Divalent-cation tolerance protein CutA [Jannaschia aquimarina]SNT37682.1 divalent cation tolerance protein [Jannaschia aquimarina]
MTDILILHIACPDTETASVLGARLVEERLAACTHVLAPHESRYRWAGSVACEGEVTLLAKTRAELGDAVTARVTDLHPYEVPAILGWKADFVSAAYADWVRTETRAP